MEFQAKFRERQRASAPIPRLKIKIPVPSPKSEPSSRDAAPKTEAKPEKPKNNDVPSMKIEKVKTEAPPPIKTEKIKSDGMPKISEKPKAEAPTKPIDKAKVGEAAAKTSEKPRTEAPAKSDRPHTSKSDKYYAWKMESVFVPFKGREMTISTRLRVQHDAVTEAPPPKPPRSASNLEEDREYHAEPAASSDELSDDADAEDALLHRKKRQRVAELVQLPERPTAAKEAKRVSEEEAIKKAEQLKRRKEDMQVIR